MTADTAGSSILSTGVVAVLRAPDADAYLPVVTALVEAGVTAIELTLTTPGTIAGLDRLRRALPPTAELGIGTVTTAAEAHAAIDAGARFLVSPVVVPEVLAAAREAGVPAYPGALTPGEVHAAREGGAAAVKLFPASTVGPEYIRHLHGPFPGLPVLPSGGVGLTDIPAWIGAGAVAVSLGGPLLGAAFAGEPLDLLAGRARTALRLVAESRGA